MTPKPAGIRKPAAAWRKVEFALLTHRCRHTLLGLGRLLILLRMGERVGKVGQIPILPRLLEIVLDRRDDERVGVVIIVVVQHRVLVEVRLEDLRIPDLIV